MTLINFSSIKAAGLSDQPLSAENKLKFELELTQFLKEWIFTNQKDFAPGDNCSIEINFITKAELAERCNQFY